METTGSPSPIMFIVLVAVVVATIVLFLIGRRR
jgi:hypothetical protein